AGVFAAVARPGQRDRAGVRGAVQGVLHVGERSDRKAVDGVQHVARAQPEAAGGAVGADGADAVALFRIHAQADALRRRVDPYVVPPPRPLRLPVLALALVDLVAVDAGPGRGAPGRGVLLGGPRGPVNRRGFAQPAAVTGERRLHRVLQPGQRQVIVGRAGFASAEPAVDRLVRAEEERRPGQVVVEGKAVEIDAAHVEDADE